MIRMILVAVGMFCFVGQVSAQDTATAAEKSERTEADVKKLIDQQGRVQPDWWESVPLDYPKTLDLDWPLSAPAGSWNSQRNIGQYNWDIINPNPKKWRSGIRLMYELLKRHSSDVAKRNRDMQTLAQMYYNFDQDYARAAFFWEHAGVKMGAQTPAVTKLAICYWKLGNKKMAYDLLAGSPIYYDTIKVLADMGYTDTAVKLADQLSQYTRPDLAYLYAGDACRTAGRYDDAIKYYQKVLDQRPGDMRQQIYFQKTQPRAQANITAIRVFEKLDLSKVKDGTYTGSGQGYVGPIQVAVTVKSGKIADVKVTEHHEKQSYSAITDTPAQIVARQGVQGVDAVSGATITSEAIVNGVAQALGKAMP